MNLIDFDLKDEPWKILDLLASYWGASQNVDQPMYWIERDMGAKDYRLSFVLSRNKPKCSFEEVFAATPALSQWLDAQGWNPRTVYENVQALVTQEINDTNWNVERLPEQKIVRSLPRRLPPLQWSFYDFSRKAYWAELLNKPTFGRSVDQWARHMKSYLTKEKTAETTSLVTQQMRRLMERQPNWELQNGQSFRVWARHNKSWERFLDLLSVSYRVDQDGKSLPLWALENNWAYGCKKWCKESGLSLSFVPTVDHIPAAWIEGEDVPPNGSLWHWACRISNATTVEDLISFEANIVSSTDSMGRTGLHWACAVGRMDVIETLLAKGASLETEDLEGKIPAELVPQGLDSLFNTLEDRRIKQKRPEIESALP